MRYIKISMSKSMVNFDYKSLLKYAGGKESEIPIIKEFYPDFNNYYEPFVGGGAVYFDIVADKYFINDKSEDLINLYKCVQSGDANLFKTIKNINHNWHLLEDIAKSNFSFFLQLIEKVRSGKITDQKLADTISSFVIKNADMFNGMLSTEFNYYIDNFIVEIKKNLVSKIKRIVKLENDNKTSISEDDINSIIESALKGAFYTHFRMIYNKRSELNVSQGFDAGIYLFIRETCYSSMFRFNNSGEFNVPYGGKSYNNKDFEKRLTFYKSKKVKEKLHKTKIESLDFYEFMKKHPPKMNDFIFIDPPYDSNFSSYDNNSFDENDQKRLADYLINECKGKFMIVIKSSSLIKKLYKAGTKCCNQNSLKVLSFDKQYSVSFMNRNDKNAEHLIIMNY